MCYAGDMNMRSGCRFRNSACYRQVIVVLSFLSLA
jgi:hypothetical protein